MQDFFILGSKVTRMTEEELFAEVEKIIAAGRKEVILNTNVHGIHIQDQHPWLKDYRNSTRIVHIDGAGIMLAAKLLGFDAGPRVSMNDAFWPLIETLVRSDRTIYMLGGTPKSQEGATKIVRTRAPKLKLLGSHHGDFTKKGAENDAVIDQINALKPDVLLVGFGMPIQEKWVKDNVDRLDVKVIMVVGGLFYRLSGEVPLAPEWITRNGFEWLYLSMWRPRRFFDRYMVENPRFLARVLFSRIKNGSDGNQKIQTETT